MDPDAQHRFDNVGVIQQLAREQHGWRWLNELLADALQKQGEAPQKIYPQVCDVDLS